MQNETNRAELEAVILEVINSQTDCMGSVVQFMDWTKTYLRASNIMASCLTAALEGSPEEQNITALARHLSDVEAWIVSQDALFNERYCAMAVLTEMIRPAREGNRAPDSESQGGGY